MYEDFIKKAISQDSRNAFGTLDEVEEYQLPIMLNDFYKHANPIDVEVTQEDNTAIRFYPASSLKQLQNEYALPKDTFVFASREGDPVLLKDDKVYIAVHGTGEWKFEFIASSFNGFINSII